MRLRYSKLLPVVFLFLTFFSLFLFFQQELKGIKSIPSCLQGCDLYYENGFALGVLNNPGQTWLSSSHGWLGHLASLPRAYFYLRLLFTKLLGLDYYDSWRSVVPMSYFILLIGLFASYFFFKEIFSDRYLCALLAAFNMNIFVFPYFKYGEITYAFLPAYLLLLMRMSVETKPKRELLFWALLVLTAVFISNIHAIGIFLVYSAAFFAYLVFVVGWPGGNAIPQRLKSPEFLKKSLIFLSFFAVSFVLILLPGWWSRVFFVYHGADNIFKFDVYEDLNISQNYFFSFLRIVRLLLCNFNGPLNVIVSFLTVLGLASYIIYRRRLNEGLRRSLDFVFLFTLFSIFSFLFTIPLFHKSLSAIKAYHYLRLIFKAVFSGLALVFLFRYKIRGKLPLLSIASGLLLAAFIAFAANSIREEHNTDKRWGYGKREVPAHYLDLIKWLRSNKDPAKMVVLTNNGLGFSLYSLTGVSLLSGRQSHFFIFDEFQKYWLDSAKIFYGSNNEARRDLLKRYSESAGGRNMELYLYWDHFWSKTEWPEDNGEVYPSDPFRFEDSPEMEKALKDNGIKFKVNKDAIFEPSAQSNFFATKLDIIYITSDNYFSLDHPWKPDLDRYLQEVWSYYSQGKKTAALYKVINY